MDRTGGTYGLLFFLRDVFPHLEKAFAGRSFEVHIIGGGEAMPGVLPYLRHPRLIRRGFAPDLDAELASADVFCLFNNAAPYQAAYTRHLVTWSSGLCLVAHEKSRLAIPEIKHGENALLASTGEEAASLITRAALDRELNLRLRKGGRETYLRYFTPENVVTNLETVFEESMGSKK